MKEKNMEIPPILFRIEMINQESGVEYQDNYNTNSFKSIEHSLEDALRWVKKQITE